MYLRIVGASVRRRWRRKALASLSVALGVTLTSALAAVSLDIGDKVNRELGRYGANFEITPAAGSLARSLGEAPEELTDPTLLLPEADLTRLASFFWAHNVLAAAPELSVPVRTASGRVVLLSGTWFRHPVPRTSGGTDTTGMRSLAPWWRVDGRWPEDTAVECLVGRRIAAALGLSGGHVLSVDGPRARVTLRVTGILTTGGPEEDRLWTPLSIAQDLLGTSGRYARLHLAALTTPETHLAYRDPSTLSATERERLECTAFPSTIARALERTLPGAHARVVREVTETQGAVLTRVRLLLLLVAACGVVASALGVLGTMAAAVLERRAEIGLLKAIGASRTAILALFLGEASALGLAGGVAGYAVGCVLALAIGRFAFGAPTRISPLVLPLSLLTAVCVSAVGSALPVRRALAVDPVRVLHET
jgi:putative ABC transport system permease protein